MQLTDGPSQPAASFGGFYPCFIPSALQARLMEGRRRGRRGGATFIQRAQEVELKARLKMCSDLTELRRWVCATHATRSSRIKTKSAARAYSQHLYNISINNTPLILRVYTGSTRGVRAVFIETDDI